MATRALAPIPANHSVLITLRDELRALDIEIQERQLKRQKVQALLDLYSPPEQVPRRQAAKPVKIRSAAGVRKPARGTHALAPTRAYRSATPTTVEMARRVLSNEGAPMTPKDIGAKIFQTFGVKPAKSLYQMLYKRAVAKKGFTMDGAGKYGLQKSHRL